MNLVAHARRHDELPDRLIQHVPTADAPTQALVERLIARAETDANLSADFRAKWLAAVA